MTACPDRFWATRRAMTIRAALATIPRECRYHGDKVEGRDLWRFAGACCATGEPSLMRRRADAAVDELQSQIATLSAALVEAERRAVASEVSRG